MAGSSAPAGGHCPVRWLNRHALVELPGQVSQANAQAVGEQLQALLSRDLLVLIVDMRGTTVCDHACGEVLAHVYQQAAVTGAPAGGFSYVGMTTDSQGVAVPADASAGAVWFTFDGGKTWRPSAISGS